VGFHESYVPNFSAPFVQEAVVSIAMQFQDIIPIPQNGTSLIIGSIEQVLLQQAMLEPDGFVNLSAADVLISQGLDAYFVANSIGRLPYAKP